MLNSELFKKILYTFAANTFIAVFLAILDDWQGWIGYWSYAQAIGFSILALSLLTRSSRLRIGARFILIILGVALGLLLAGGIFHSSIGINQAWLKSFAISVILGIVVSAFFYGRERVLRTEAELQAKQVKLLLTQKQAALGQLKLLQAQVEPHFLFNTLAHVNSLIRQAPERAEQLLGHLTHYLRSSLNHTRREQGTLADEITMLQEYLAILKIRMGERLSYHIHLPDTCKMIPFPPMLLQPLVENAIKHGLEPSLTGGMLTIDIEQTQEGLLLTVIDTGVGLNPYRSHSGIGLSNIRERLMALYGEHASLSLTDHPPHGVKATLHIPLAGRDQEAI